MLSIFPQLLSFTLLGIFLIRIIIGLVIFYIAYQMAFTKREKLIKKLELAKHPFSKSSVVIVGFSTLISSSFLIVGFLTQISSIVSGYLLLNIMMLDSGKEKILGQTKLFYITISIICLSFLFLGAGFFAVDLPL
jgi:uncharacterized membrane protein YfcA